MALANPKNIRLELRSLIRSAKFPPHVRPVVESMLVRAVRYYRVQRNHLSISRPSAAYGSAGQVRRKGRPDLSMQRDWLVGRVLRAWMVGFKKYPTINNKRRNYPSPFVRFCEPILRRGIGHILSII
jgi:hypothetical protein